MQIIDLSQPITNQMPVYPGDPSVRIEEAGKHSSDGFCDHVLTLGTHAGTHMDAPLHMIDGGKQLKEYTVDRFICEAVCIEGFDAAKLQNMELKPGMAILFYTGASDYYHEEKYWHEYEVPSQEICQLLKDKQVSMVGVDSGSIDREDNFPVHKSLLGADMLILENLTNLKSLIGKRFELIALPIKLEKDAAPARVVARVGQHEDFVFRR